MNPHEEELVSSSPPEKRFKVALSFPGELRDFVKEVAAELAETLQPERVLYDKYHEAEFAQLDLDLHLQRLYHQESELIAVFLNADYERKPWPGLEWRVVRNLILAGRGIAVIVFRFDDTPIAGLLPSDGYISVERRSPAEVAKLILQRLSINAKSGPQSLPVPLIETPRTWLAALKNLLVRRFVDTEDDTFQGHFSRGPAADAQRWQSPGGELTNDPTIPKRPYYETYWAYHAAIRIAPEYVEKWRPITEEAIRRHFGPDRWLRVMRDFSFAKGPTARASFAQSVRHTARAADLLHMLLPGNPRVAEVAWQLVAESKTLQRSDGGWIEFRGTEEPSSLWSTIYIFRFLSTLVSSEPREIPEWEKFREKASALLESTELFLIDGWRQNRWTVDPELPWAEVTAAVLPEVAHFIRDRTLVKDSYSALRELVTPSGQLETEGISRVAGAPSEAIQALGIAFALKVAGEDLTASDSRYRRLDLWVTEHMRLSELSAHDVGFAVEVVDLEAEVPT